jgi:phage internal scaffolding protein
LILYFFLFLFLFVFFLRYFLSFIFVFFGIFFIFVFLFFYFGVFIMSNSVFVRSPFNYDMFAASNETALVCSDPSLTQQQFAAESDINTIVDTFMKTGHLPDPVSLPQYVDDEGVFDFQSAMNVVRAADENFMRMDAKLRARFHNSPQEFLEFFADSANSDEAIRLGLGVPNSTTFVASATEVVPPSKAE